MGHAGESPANLQPLQLGTELWGVRRGKGTIAENVLREQARAAPALLAGEGLGSGEALTAPDECFPQMKQFSTKQMPNTTPGYSVAVWEKRSRLGSRI